MALLRYFEERFPTSRGRDKARNASLQWLLNPVREPGQSISLLDPDDRPHIFLLRQRPVQLLLGASEIVEELRDPDKCESLRRTFPRDLVVEVAANLADRPDLRDKLVGWLAAPRDRQSAAAS